MIRRFLFCVAVAAPLPLLAQDQYGYVARLGRDTISVERIWRSADKLTSDQVERFPEVVLRHTEILLAADKSIRRLEMETRIPNATLAANRERHFLAEYLRDSLRVTVRTSEGTKTRSWATRGSLVMPWISQMYSLFELYFLAALQRGGDSVQVRQYYPNRSINAFPIHQSFVRSLGGGKVETFHNDWLSGTGVATFDAQWRMQSYSGAKSTYKQEVVRVTKLPDIDAIGKAFVEKERRTGVASELSVRDTARATIGKATLLVDYGRPLVRGRQLLGNIIPYESIWRTGANEATQFTTSAAITVAGLALAPGSYTLWTIPTKDSVQLIVNKETGQWGTQYRRSNDLGRARLKVERVGKSTERFTISVVPKDATHGTLRLEWGTFRWSAPVVVR